MADRIDDGLGGFLFFPARDIRYIHGRPGPLTIVLGKDLDRVAADRRGTVQRLADATGDGHVCAEFEQGIGHRAAAFWREALARSSAM